MTILHSSEKLCFLVELGGDINDVPSIRVRGVAELNQQANNGKRISCNALDTKLCFEGDPNDQKPMDLILNTTEHRFLEVLRV